MGIATNPEQAVLDRYARAAQEREAALCCPVDYDPRYLAVIPDEIKERDYGCGDPSAFVREGDTVLDLGSGGGKICYIAAQIVGPAGRVIGVDMNDQMLALAERHRAAIGDRLGYHNVEFRKGRIQDLRLDLTRCDAYLSAHPVRGSAELAAFEAFADESRAREPLVAGESVDVVLSNCVLNLVRPADKVQLFDEIFRVVRRGGRVAISDIVSDEDVPDAMRRDPELWSGCISGALREDEFLDAFDRAGFYGMRIAKRDERPWRTVEGIEFRSVTVTAHKGKQGRCLERRQAVIYRGPWKRVIDDDGHVLERGQRMAVCDKTFALYGKEPYASDILPVPPLAEVPLDEAAEFDCRGTARRHPRETKGADYRATDAGAESCCGPEGCC
ncbi:MAG TPA: methyltransferase domain-containing protein [Gemmatimonadales bacterium]|nr:methyltransferase domain-containing protein [Gemmatimonadales bacterium]